MAKNPSCFFHNLGNLLRPLELIIPASRERVVPTEWQVRTVLGECISGATIIPAPAPQYRQHQNLALATKTGRSTGSLPENLTADVHYAINTCDFLGSGRQLIDPSRESHRQLQRIFSIYDSLSTSFFAECAFPVLYVASGHPRLRFRHLCGQR